MGGELLAGLSLTRDQLVLLSLVVTVFILLLTANVGLCWLYNRLLTEDQRHVRRAQKKKMSDVWVYQVHRPAHTASAATSPRDDPPSQQILRKLRNSYDNLCRAVETEGGQGTLGREESQVIEELEVAADLFLLDGSSGVPSRHSSLSVHDTHFQQDQPHTISQDTDVNAIRVHDTEKTHSYRPSLTAHDRHSSQHDPSLTAPYHSHLCRSPVTVHSEDPSTVSSTLRDTDLDSVFAHDQDMAAPDHTNAHHFSAANSAEDCALKQTFTLTSAEPHATNHVSDLQDVDLSDLEDLDEATFSTVTMQDFENYSAHGARGVSVDGKRTRRGKRRGSVYDNLGQPPEAERATDRGRGSTYDNLPPPFPVAEFHNEAFDFAAESTASVEVASDLEL